MARIIIDNADTNDFNELAKLAREGKIHTFCMTDEKDWIPVSERLPDKNGNYLCTVDYGEDGIEVMQRIYWDTLGGFEKRYNKNDKVIAWRPLPEPYKRGEEE